MDGRMLKTLWGMCLLAALLPAQAQEVYYIHTDALGSPVAETDANRNVVARFEYEPYGRRLNGSNDDKPGYTGHVMDTVTGLVQMQQRYYDPGIGRFLSVDPVDAYGGAMRHFNRYAYAYNSPFNFTDPDGRRGELHWTAADQVTYTVRWTMTGATPGFTPEQVNAQIAQDFSGTASINGTDVTITAQGIYEATPGNQPLNTVNIIQGPDVIGSNTHHTKGIGGDQVQLGAGGADPATVAVASHEIGGHAGGAGDQFKGGVGVDGQRLAKDVAGPPNVMKDRSGMPANAQTRGEILRASTNTNTCAPGVTAANGGC